MCGLKTRSSLRGEVQDWAASLEMACLARGIETREGLSFNQTTGEVSDAMAWELEGDD